jgi:hypothetical protein
MRKRYENAGSDVMAYIAAVALNRGKSQEWLARRLGVKAGNVIGHFNAIRPRESTVAEYAKLLKIPPEAISIKSGAGLSDEQLRYWWDRLMEKVDESDVEFEDGTGEELRQFLSGIAETKRREIVEAVALASLTGEMPPSVRWVDWPYQMMQHPELVCLSAFMPPKLNLRKRLRMKQPHEDTLYDLWKQLRPPAGLLNEEQADVIVRMAGALLKAEGLDIAPMMDCYNRKRGGVLGELTKALRALSRPQAPKQKGKNKR